MAGIIALAEAERGQTRLIDSSAAYVRSHYAQTASERTRSFQRWCANSGIQPFTMTTDVDPIVPLTELFARRAVRRGAL